jgi:SAM-dependent methyltransferase
VFWMQRSQLRNHIALPNIRRLVSEWIRMPKRRRIFSKPACQPQLPRQRRKQSGVYYTPPEIVKQIVELALGDRDWQAHCRILDPACGAGEFLIESLRFCRQRRLPASIFGIDIDESAVLAARTRLLELDPRFPIEQVCAADALGDLSLRRESFDVIVGNPPYVNVRELARSRPRSEIESLRERFSCACGNFDLYVLFIERSIELLRSGGRCALVLPNKWATVEYARRCRELLLTRTSLEHVIDLTDVNAFSGARVYPQALIFRKTAAPRNHEIRVRCFTDVGAASIPQASLSTEALYLGSSLDVESKVITLPLDQCATLLCGTAGYSAEKIARRLVDEHESRNRRDLAHFITSGNIDRYSIRLGNVRYLNRDYFLPRLPLDIAELTPRKRQLFSEPKIVVAGMSRRLEAAWDQRRLALGVQVFSASEFHVDPHYLLALLNSKLLSYLFATRFAAKRLSGGYLSINKRELARLPIRIAASQDLKERTLSSELSELARNWRPSMDDSIDALVYRLYRLEASEIARVESHFASTIARAA